MYRAKCISIKNAEQFSVTYSSAEYNYTLYYNRQTCLIDGQTENQIIEDILQKITVMSKGCMLFYRYYLNAP